MSPDQVAAFLTMDVRVRRTGAFHLAMLAAQLGAGRFTWWRLFLGWAVARMVLERRVSPRHRWLPLPWRLELTWTEDGQPRIDGYRGTRR